LQEDGYSEQGSCDFEDVVSFRLITGAPSDSGTLQVNAVICGRQMLKTDEKNIVISSLKNYFYDE